MATVETSRRVLGIDPGLNVTGYAVLEAAPGGPRLCEAGVIRSRRGGTLAERIAEIYDGVAEVLASFQPRSMAIEELYSHYERPRTAILMGHARGAICLAGAKAGAAVVSYSATRIKKVLTGAGRASKDQVQRAVTRELSLAAPPEPHDVADAIAVALCHAYQEPTWTALFRRRA